MTNGLAAIGLGLAGAMAGVPIAAIAYGAQLSGPVRLPARWWTGSPARPTEVIVTAALATAAAITAATTPPGIALPAFWLFTVVGVGLAIIDARCRRLPHRLTGSLWLSSGLSFLAAAILDGDVEPLLRAAGAGATTSAILLLVALAMPGQLGLGDVVLAGAVTFNLGWLSWQAAATGLLAGLVIQGSVSIARSRRRADRAKASPMGPALIAGWLLAVALAT
ncbi:prepilin peptidase [Salinispora arenicola]|uniref:prepilin peptidase n=1 Tax=Salinispora arenicola TaxID=168697 RepID=UPI00036E59DA|nr:prepilin peptidase [Salinispora arenicola]